MDAHPEIKDLLSLLTASPTPWHCVHHLCLQFQNAGFTRLKEDLPWVLKPGCGYFVTRNGSSFAAFIVPTKKIHSAHILGAHTDSPGFRLKPHCEYRDNNAILFGVDTYGGPITSSWFNRDLGLAGRVISVNAKGKLCNDLVNISEYPCTLAALAPHLETSKEEPSKIDKQKQLALLASFDSNTQNKASYLEFLLKSHIRFKQILSHELYTYPLEKPALVGRGELVASYRLDNLSSVHAAARALLSCKKIPSNTLPMVIFWDNEEIGSDTAQGASSPFLQDTLSHIGYAIHMSPQELLCLKPRSFCLSIDAGHAYHPNHPEAYETRHRVHLNLGFAIKLSTNHRYASDTFLSALAQKLCLDKKIPFQLYLNHSNIRGGTTIGPITASGTGIRTLDIGPNVLSMHSARELLSCVDQINLIKFLTVFLETKDTAPYGEI